MIGWRNKILHLHSRKSNAEPIKSIIYRGEDSAFVHACTLKSTINEELDLKSKWIRKIIVSESHPRTKKYFTSIDKLEKEIKRHINSPYWYIIHPFSEFMILWDQIMFIVFLVNWYIILFQIANQKDLTALSTKINFAIQCPCYINIALNFFVGYFSKYEVVLDQRSIASHYLKTWFFTDVITSIPFQVVQQLWVNQFDEMALNCIILYQSLKILTFGRLRRYFKRMLRFWKISFVNYMILVLVLTSLLIFHATATIYQFGGNLFVINNANSDIPLNKVALIDPNRNIGIFWRRYLLCMYLTALRFYCFSFAFSHNFHSSTWFSVSVDTPVIVISYICQLYALVKVIEVFEFKYSSKIKYQKIVNQLEEYMRKKHLPLQIKKSLIEFYEQRYQFRYFKERAINANLSESLRRELLFHSCQLFIKSTPIFNDISSTNLHKIVSCLIPEIYMPNDLIIRAGTTGSCMFFIVSGTVSIRSTTGEEMKHLEDGDHFGEISIFTEKGQRVSNIVAIEYCEVYRLDKTDYEKYIAVIPELATKFKELAIVRLTETSSTEEKNIEEQKKKFERDYTGDQDEDDNDDDDSYDDDDNISTTTR